MASTPVIQTFDSLTDDWSSWIRRFDQWLTISPYAEGEHADAKMRAAFLTSIGSSTFKLLCSLCAPRKPEECTYASLKEKLNSQFGIEKLVLAERHRFYNYKQREGQPLIAYLAELRKLATTCDWSEDQLAKNLRDKFVMGIQNERLLQQLLMQDHKKQLQELVEFATTFEVAKKESFRRAEDSSISKATDSVAATQNKSRRTDSSHIRGNSKRQQQQNTTQSGKANKCTSCGENHLRNTCRFRNAVSQMW